MKGIILFNPRATDYKPRIPNSVLSVAASIEGKYQYAIVDGNIEKNPLQKIEEYVATGNYNVFALSAMPGPQLKQAIPFSKTIKEKYPLVKIIWGGYFASNQSEVVMKSGFVDYIVYGPGDIAFLKLLHSIENVLPVDLIPNLIWNNDDGKIIKNHKDELYDQDALPALPYKTLNTFYPIQKYLGKTYLGTKTIAYHSSIGCPFKCSFCGIVPIYNARWKGKSAQLIYSDIKYLKDDYGGNAIEFHDNNFFVSEKRTVEFS
ncbi:MAG: cobalamin B12-binding domain-containing protein, partial [Fimbriimonadaceae bacterium]|nr:cobalamin B12-binding domain-containing protein [Chitinophagales bacterium]